MPGLLKLARSLTVARRLAQRPFRQQWLVVEALVSLWTAKLTMTILPFERWRGLLQRPYRGAEVLPPVDRVAEVVWAVDRVSQRWARSLTCLPRAIAVRKMMARRRWPCRLEIGVAREVGGLFEAHAWIEYEGQIIIGNVPNMERYAKLPMHVEAGPSP